MTGLHLSRRSLLSGAVSVGVACWATPTAWGVPLPERPRLVVIALDGGADGLSIAPPVGDPAHLALRGRLAVKSSLPFDDDFGLHPKLVTLAEMARAGQVRLAPAAASPSLSRSHFFEQDVLQSGLVDPRRARSGWLNRSVSTLDPKGDLRAVSVGVGASLAVTGPTPFVATEAALDPNMAWRLTELYREEPELLALVKAGRAMAEQKAKAALAESAEPPEVRGARLAGRLLAAPEGPSAAFLTISGFDTHVGQGDDHGVMGDRLGTLDAVLAALRAETGSAWSRTAVVVFTEFGRTVRPNGSGGTDHGAAGTAILTGGAVKAGGLLGDWPTLAKLHEGRDLAPGLDLRSLFKGVLAEHWGLNRRVLEQDVFPGSDGAPALTGLIA
jgi:uncharacterized protein (DUF1501 family)